jgi:dynein heavy chain
MFSGLSQTGAWSCFDEFNRIDIEVLSVVAQQVLSILKAVTQGLTKFTFEGCLIKLDCGVGIFVTMNPGIVCMCVCVYVCYICKCVCV